MGQAHAHNTLTPAGPPAQTHKPTQSHTYTLTCRFIKPKHVLAIAAVALWSHCLRLFSCLLDIGPTRPEVLPICIFIAKVHTIDNLAKPAAVADFGNLFEPMCVRQQAELRICSGPIHLSWACCVRLFAIHIGWQEEYKVGQEEVVDCLCSSVESSNASCTAVATLTLCHNNNSNNINCAAEIFKNRGKLVVQVSKVCFDKMFSLTYTLCSSV